MLPFRKPKELKIENPKELKQEEKVQEGTQFQIQKQNPMVKLELTEKEASYLYNSLKKGNQMLLGKTPEHHKTLFAKIEKIFRDAGAIK